MKKVWVCACTAVKSTRRSTRTHTQNKFLWLCARYKLNKHLHYLRVCTLQTDIFFFAAAARSFVSCFQHRLSGDFGVLSSVVGIFIPCFFASFVFPLALLFPGAPRPFLLEWRTWKRKTKIEEKKREKLEMKRTRKCSGIQANHSIHSASSELIQPNVFKWWIICNKYIVLCLCEHLVLISCGRWVSECSACIAQIVVRRARRAGLSTNSADKDAGII